MIEFYTDGSSRPSSNSGGFGVIAIEKNIDGKPAIKYANQKQFEDVTNNQMELRAILHACQIIDKYFRNEKIIIYSDSSYCVNSINIWSKKWIQNNWINSKNEQIKNIDLIQSLYNYFSKNFSDCQVSLELIKGHNGEIGNELADALATKNMNKFSEIIYKNGLKVELIDF